MSPTEPTSGTRTQPGKNVRADEDSRRTGVLSMILLLALGIANIFTFRPIIIIFCALAMFVSPPNPGQATRGPSPYATSPTCTDF
jgi:hypothetical protein